MRPELETMNISGQIPVAIRREEIDGVSFGAQGKPGGRPRRVEVSFVEQHPAPSGNGRAAGDAKFFRSGELVRQEPAANSRRDVGRIIEFNGVHLRRDRVRGGFVDDHGNDRRGRRIGATRRAIQLTADPPMSLLARGIEGRALVERHERKAFSIGDRIPGIVVSEVLDRFSQRALQVKPLSSAVETSQILPSDVGDGGITRNKRRSVSHDHHIFPRLQVGDAAASKIEFDAFGETESVQVERPGADVFQFDVLKVVCVVGIAGGWFGGMIHDFRDHERGCVNHVGSGHQSRPGARKRRIAGAAGEVLVARVEDSGDHPRVVHQRDRPGVDLGVG